MTIMNEVSAISQLDTVLSNLRNSEFEFYPTGSRYFHTENEKSDWDFFAQDSWSIRHWLVNTCNFIPLSKKYDPELQYSDLNMAAVYHHITTNVHIQLQLDVNKKIMAQKLVSSMFPYVKDQLSKEHPVMRRNVWNAAFAAIGDVKLESTESVKTGTPLQPAIFTTAHTNDVIRTMITVMYSENANHIQKIQAIKTVREQFGYTLKEAKELCDAIYDSIPRRITKMISEYLGTVKR